jgi:homospermidine synthase
MVSFDKKILCIGYGSVAQCMLPILFKHLDVPPTSVTVMDFEDKADELSAWTAKGVRYVRDRITPDNLGAILAQYVSDGDLLIDLAWNIDCCEILQWCHDHGVLYINTSVEVWDPYEGAESKHPTTRTLYWRHMNVRKMVSDWPAGSVTAVVEHGANPGLISHWTKRGLIDIAARCLEDGKFTGEKAERVRDLAERRVFNELAMELGVKVIHCSERDTQISNVPKQVDEFVNTWSIEGFREEGTTTAEMGWGDA